MSSATRSPRLSPSPRRALPNRVMRACNCRYDQRRHRRRWRCDRRGGARARARWRRYACIVTSPCRTTRPVTPRRSIRAWPSDACGNGRTRPMNGLTALVARRCSAVCTSAKVALPEPAMRMRRMMTSPGSISTGRAPILPSTTTVALCAAERRLSPNVPVTTFSSTTSAPCLPVRRHTSRLNFRSGLTMTSSAPACRTSAALSLRAGDGDHPRLHALGDLDLMQAQSAAGAGDQHDLSRLDRARRRAPRARWCRPGRPRARPPSCRRRPGWESRCARARGEFGIAAAALLAQHAAVAAKIVAAAQAIAAAAAEQPLIEHHALADARRRHLAPAATISPAISWPRMRPGCPGILPARESTSW